MTIRYGCSFDPLNSNDTSTLLTLLLIFALSSIQAGFINIISYHHFVTCIHLFLAFYMADHQAERPSYSLALFAMLHNDILKSSLQRSIFQCSYFILAICLCLYKLP
jgi:hypothetical protein